MPAGLYIHIPFCVKKCEYCDFVSFAGCGASIDAYLEALAAEAEQYRGMAVDTVFIGGGTPSVLSPSQLARLFRIVHDCFEVSCGAEFTMELNPGTVTRGKIKAMLEGGINRVSAGVQSFNDAELRCIGRIHSAAEAYDTVLMLDRAGFSNISIDLMESLPMQTPESFKVSLKAAAALPLKHISVYSLIIEEGTPIKEKYDSGVYELPDEDTDREMYAETARLLAESGFRRYEISNYAIPGFESRHNLKYWSCGEYIGIGAAAHSYINGVRFSNTSKLKDYISGNFRSGEREVLMRSDKIGEFMILGLRKTDGISSAEFSRRFGCAPRSIYADRLDKFERLGLMEESDDRIRLTPRGLDVANAVMCEFLI